MPLTMDLKVSFIITLGLCSVLVGEISASIFGLNGYNEGQFHDMDARTRNKRNVTSLHDDVIDVTSQSTQESIPQWKVDLLKGTFHGSEQYMQRNLYKDNPNKEPTLCFNNVTEAKVGYFYCPAENETDAQKFCCGPSLDQRCCTQPERTEDKSQTTPAPNMVPELDLVTGLSVAAGVAFTTLCLFLYCCCCQRRPEIHDGIKLMWVRRSFGKELNRLDQPAYHDHMTVVNSITGIRESRHGSRHGSRSGSRHGSRNPSRQGSVRSNNRSRPGSFKFNSRNPSPSVSRRASHDHTHLVHNGSSKHGHNKNHHLGSDLPKSDVVITVTTPSDEHGPTAPLLTATQEVNEQQ